jgi:hypothetical protein
VRIFDRILSGSDVYLDLAESRDAPSQLKKLEPAPWRKLMNGLPRVIADNAAHYVEEQYVKAGEVTQQWNVVGPQNGSLLPPFDEIWMEYAAPESWMGQWADGYADSPNTGFRLQRLDWEGGHQLVISNVVLDIRGPEGNFLLTNKWAWVLYLDQDGVCVDAVCNTAAENFEGANALTGIPVLALNWMNMNNLGLVQQGPSAALQKKRTRNGQFPGVDYYAIEVLPKYRSEWEKQSGGVPANRFHTVRGSWATYTAERPRFGRHRPEDIGRFWRRGSAAGNKGKGTINKEYHVTDEAAQ